MTTERTISTPNEQTLPEQYKSETGSDAKGYPTSYAHWLEERLHAVEEELASDRKRLNKGNEVLSELEAKLKLLAEENKRLTKGNEQDAAQQISAGFNCRFHPTDWWHEIGCEHMEWSKEQLVSALKMAKKSLWANIVKHQSELSQSKAEVERLAKEGEVHWKTRRSLLKDVASLRQSLAEADEAIVELAPLLANDCPLCRFDVGHSDICIVLKSQGRKKEAT